MGAAAAVAFKRAGLQVLVWDLDPDQVGAFPGRAAQLESWMDQHLDGPASSGGELVLASGLGEIDRQVEVILDCIVEDLDQKVALLQGFPGLLQRQGIFLTTTSGLSITEMGWRSGCGPRLAGTHFWNPPHLMPLVEVVRGEDTEDEVIEITCQLMESIGKLPVRVNRDLPGFIGNRMLHAMWREAISLVEAGVATPEDVDRVARLTFGLRQPVVGPLENMDLVGLDLIDRIHGYLLADLADNHRPSEYLQAKVEKDRLGIKTGQGFYDWSRRSADQLIARRDQQIVRQLEYLRSLEESES